MIDAGSPPHAAAGEGVYSRSGSFAVFNQRDIKLEFKDSTSKAEYYRWLDDMTAQIGRLVPGAEIAEKSYARAEPRINTDVYYDTADYRLLHDGMVLRTTCNKNSHAFCAFKLAEGDHDVRRDHRYMFEGDDKLAIQTAPTSPQAVAIMKRLLARNDLEHPGLHLARATGIRASDLAPAICLEQYRHPFFVWLDGRDALRCSMDRAQVYNLRVAGVPVRHPFSEIELPIYPHIEDEIAKDARVGELIQVLGQSLRLRFGVELITRSKYQRAARALQIG